MTGRYIRLPCGHRSRLRAHRIRRRHSPWAGTLYEVEAPLRAAMRSLAVWLAITIAGAALLFAAVLMACALLWAWLK